MLSATTWQTQPQDQLYIHPSLASEGFIHCTAEPALLMWVANHFFKSEPGAFVLLCIDEAVVSAEVKWEAVGDQIFPHIYGPLNLNAVVRVLDFPRRADGEFVMPPELEKPNE
jgi:uncharacterized protein (DUF952 family)